MNNEVSCGIIKDLLVGYTENILSSEGNKLVKDHISKCECCKKEYDILKSEIPKQTGDYIKFNYLKKINFRFVITLIILLAITVISNVVYLIHSEPTLGGKLFVVYLLILICLMIVVKYLVPIFGVVYGIVYLKDKRKKRYIIPIIIFGVWLILSIYTYIEQYGILQTFSLL